MRTFFNVVQTQMTHTRCSAFEEMADGVCINLKTLKYIEG